MDTEKIDRKRVLKLILGHFFHFHFKFLFVFILALLFIPAVLTIYSLFTESKISPFATNILSFYMKSLKVESFPILILPILLLDLFYFSLFILFLFKRKFAWFFIKNLHCGVAIGLSFE